MKKALMVAALISMTMAQAQDNPGGRSTDAGSASTALNFHMTVVPGCAVSLDNSYDSNTDTYNGTDTNPATVTINTQAGTEPNFRCQTGTQVTITASALKGDGTTFNVIPVTTRGSAPVTLNGEMSLLLSGFSFGVNNDDKTLEGDFVLSFLPGGNVPATNGDMYSMIATFKPHAGQFEPAVGDYTGTLNVSVVY